MSHICWAHASVLNSKKTISWSGVEVSIYAQCAGVSTMQHLLSEPQMQQSLERVLAPEWATPVPITFSTFSTRFAGSQDLGSGEAIHVAQPCQ